jgi:hypothetical protein
MKPQLRRVGESQSAVVVIDDFTGFAEDVAQIADALAPFPMGHNYYPGLRRVIRAADTEASRYAERLCSDAAQFIWGAFDIERFDLVEASFSMVTRRPADLIPPQRLPHFDSTDPKYLALLHYLRVPQATGTAFYRQRFTGIERVTESNHDQFVSTLKAEAAQLPAHSGYITASNEFFEQIDAVEGVPDRLLIYQGSLLHSGIIPPDMNLSGDPKVGRLTANIFIRLH